MATLRSRRSLLYLGALALFVLSSLCLSLRHRMENHYPEDRFPLIATAALSTGSSSSSSSSSSSAIWKDMLYDSKPCSHSISVLWVIKNMFGSALWSGFDIADAINGVYPNTTTKRFPDLVVLPMQVGEIKKLSNQGLLDHFVENGYPKEKRSLDLCLFVKYIDHEVLDKCREMGAKTAILWVDGHPNLLQREDHGLNLTDKDPYDFHILPNTLTTQHYRGAISGTEWVIPQHDSNVKQLRQAHPAAPVRVIGWQGGRDNRMAPQVREAVQSWAMARGIEFRELFYVGARAPRHELEAERDLNFEKVVSELDIMVIFPSAKDTFEKLIYKPNGRNIFSLSMGIPTVLFPYVSYTEALKWSHYPAFASNLPELLRWLDILVSRPDARVALSNMGLEFAQQLSIENISKMWAFHLRDALCQSD